MSSMSLSLIAAQPRMLDPSMPNPSSNESSVQLADRIGNVMLQPRHVRKPQIQLAGVVLLGKFEHFLCVHNLAAIVSRTRDSGACVVPNGSRASLRDCRSLRCTHTRRSASPADPEESRHSPAALPELSELPRRRVASRSHDREFSH